MSKGNCSAVNRGESGDFAEWLQGSYFLTSANGPSSLLPHHTFVSNHGKCAGRAA